VPLRPCAVIPLCRCALAPLCRCAVVPLCRCAVMPLRLCAAAPFIHSPNLNHFPISSITFELKKQNYFFLASIVEKD